MRQVLIVDDDPILRESLQDQLEGLGYDVVIAGDARALRERLLAPPAHAVLMDVRLGGPGGGPTDGVKLVPEVLANWPTARVFVISAYLTPEVVREAFAAGAVDVVRKDELFLELLAPKLRRAADEAERDTTTMPEARERALRAAWTECRAETDRQRKGVALERTLRLLLTSIEGLSAMQRVTNGDEELDLVVANSSPVPFLQQQGSVWLVECKNWTKRVGVPAVQPLMEKMRHRNGRCRLGLLVSMNGFSARVRDQLRRDSGDDRLIVTLDGDAVEDWIATPDRAGWLSARIVEAASR
jgi:CheY-like chemotaxis protein